MDKDYDKIYLQKLAHKYKQGTITPDEQLYYDTWYNHFRDQELDVSEQPEIIRDRMLHVIERHVHQKKPAAIKRLWKYAAVATLLIGCSVFAYMFLLQGRKPLQPVAQLERIKPGTNGALLTLANGKKIVLEQAQQGTVTEQGNTSLQKANDSLIVYHQGKPEQIAAISYNTLETSAGRQYQVMLPDGTKVWLNASSSLHYPTSFSGKERTVTLTGEGYFEVAKDKAHPFIVHSVGQDIKVLGTHFNVNAYADEKKITTTLLEGSVQVGTGQQTKILKPGQQAGVNNASIQISDADTQLAVAWKDGRIAFSHTPVQQVLREISRWYNIKIQYEGVVPDYTISGETSRNADLDAILKILKLSDVHYRLNGRTLTIRP